MAIDFTISEAARYLGVSGPTLRRWDRAGKFRSLRTIGNHRRYNKQMLDKFLGIQENNDVSESPIEQGNKIPYGYARVSTQHQVADGNLTRQVERIEKHIKHHHGKKAEYKISLKQCFISSLFHHLSPRFSASCTDFLER